jgi:hypothetical protein
LALAVFGHFCKFFDASEEHFARVHKEPSASAQPKAVNLSAAERALAHFDPRRLLYPGARLLVLFVKLDHCGQPQSFTP